MAIKCTHWSWRFYCPREKQAMRWLCQGEPNFFTISNYCSFKYFLERKFAYKHIYTSTRVLHDCTAGLTTSRWSTYLSLLTPEISPNSLIGPENVSQNWLHNFRPSSFHLHGVQTTCFRCCRLRPDPTRPHFTQFHSVVLKNV